MNARSNHARQEDLAGSDPRPSAALRHVQLKRELRSMSYADQVAALAPGLIQAKGKVNQRAVHQAASSALSGSAGRMPYGDRIQRAFGRHDVSGIKAHTDSRAAQGTAAMGAKAFTSGNSVAFAGGSPSMHTAAHEAAHVVQQRGGVSLKGGVGASGDRYEQHADAVADAVVSGKSAEGLLDSVSGGRAPSAGDIQRKEAEGAAVQMDEDEEQASEQPKIADDGLPDSIEDEQDMPGMDPEIEAIEQEAQEEGEAFIAANPELANPAIAEGFAKLVGPEIEQNAESAPPPKDGVWKRFKGIFKKRKNKTAKNLNDTHSVKQVAGLGKHANTAVKGGAKATEMLAKTGSQTASNAAAVGSAAGGVAIGVSAASAIWETKQAVRAGMQSHTLNKVADSAEEGGDEAMALAAKYAMRKKRKKAIRRGLGAAAAVLGVVSGILLLSSNPVGWAVMACGLGITLGVMGHKLYRRFFKKNRGVARKKNAAAFAKGCKDGNQYAMAAVRALGIDPQVIADDVKEGEKLIFTKLSSS